MVLGKGTFFIGDDFHKYYFNFIVPRLIIALLYRLTRPLGKGR